MTVTVYAASDIKRQRATKAEMEERAEFLIDYAEASGVAFDIDDTTDRLETIAAWKEDLLARIRRAQLMFELVNCDIDIGPLVDELTDFKRVCACLAWRGKEAA
jgi:hypothetical protein